MAYYLVIAYDTPSDKRRRRMVNVLKSYGERRQYSVFEARVNREQWAVLKGRLAQVVDEAEDTLAVYFISPESLGKTWRIGADRPRRHQGSKRTRFRLAKTQAALEPIHAKIAQDAILDPEEENDARTAPRRQERQNRPSLEAAEGLIAAGARRKLFSCVPLPFKVRRTPQNWLTS
ncbi:MAG: CRISPR-associated endonuclease Cas2 [Thermosphaera sp.]